MTTGKRILIFAPTQTEADALADIGAQVVICGVGMAETAATLARILTGGKPVDMAILAGIAGAVPDSGFKPGDTVVAISETVADLGAVREDKFTRLYEKVYQCPYTENVTGARKARFGTVNCVKGASPAGYDIENMEGAAFFAVCLSMGIPFLEMRSVSNFTTDDRTNWQIPLALRSLSKAIRNLLEELG